MTILQVIPDNTRGGGEVLAHQLQRHLLTKGHSSHLAFFCGKGSTEFIHNLGGVSPRDPRCYAKLRNLVQELKPDVIHAHMLPAQVATRLLSTKAHKVTTEHSTSNRRQNLRIGRALNRWIFKGFEQIAVISQGVHTVLSSNYPEFTEKYILATNGVELHKYKPALSVPSKPHLVSVGRLEPVKNLVFAVNNLALLLKSLGAEYTIYGDGQERLRIEELIKQNGWSHIHLAGRSNNLPALLPQYSAMLVPSLWEGFGLVAVEGMASGLPVLASQVSGLADLVTDETGALFNPKDAVSMQLAVRSFLSLPINTQEKMRKAASLRAQDFSIEPMFATYTSMYRELLCPKV